MKEYTVDVYKTPDILPLKDAILEDYIKHNDLIVICDKCHSVSRKKSWEMNNSKCICGCNRLADINSELLSEVTGNEIKIDGEKKSDFQNANIKRRESLSHNEDKPLIPNAVGWVIAVVAFVLVGIGIFMGFKHHYADANNSKASVPEVIETINTDADTTEEAVVPYNEEPITEKQAVSLNVPHIEEKILTVDGATIETYSGSIESEEDSVSYSYIIPVSGRYRFEIADITNSNRVSLRLYNDIGELVASDDYCSNGEGLTVRELEAGDKYEIVVSYCDDTTPYTLYIGQQKETVDTKGYNVINDSIEYTDQINVYSFSPVEDGRYRFEISELHANCRVQLMIFNHLGEVIAEDDYCSNNEGLTVKELSSSEKYSIQVRNQDGYSDYTLKIGEQKPVRDIGKYDTITDSIEYTDQRNVYRFTAKSSSVNFEISGLKSNYRVEILLFNHLDEVIEEDDYCSNGEGISAENLNVGEEYELQVRYQDGCSDYEIAVS